MKNTERMRGLTLRDKKAWYATRVTNLKYIGFGEVVGSAVLEDRNMVLIRAKILLARRTHGIVRLQPVPYFEEEFGKLFFRYGLSVHSDALTNSDKVWRSIEAYVFRA